MKSAAELLSIARWLGIVVVLLGVWLIYEMANDPYESVRTAALAKPAAGGDGGGLAVAEPPAELDYEEIQKDIEGNQRLWEPLVKKPKAAPKKVSLEQKIKGLRVVAAISEGDQVKFIIQDQTNNTERIYEKGDKVRDLTFSSFTFTHIVLSYGGETIKIRY
jgi:hypothetical protein